MLAVSAFAVSAQEGTDRKTLRVAYLEFPPVTYQEADGTPAGSFIELTRKIAAEAGYEPEFLYLPVSRVYLYLGNGAIDVWPGVTEVPSLQGNVLETWVSPSAVNLSAWYLDGTPALTNLEQLRGKRVIVIGGYTYAGLLPWLEADSDIRVTEAPNHRSAVDMLTRKRGDYLLDYRQPVREILTDREDRMIRESDVRTRNLAWVFSLAHPRAALLRDEFDDAYLRLVEKGEVPPVREITDGYMIPGYPEELR
ncbi:substrate-binding periplasmic protein [Marinobacter sp.]|uniref:substrate-binding periplasmic protein n=1 Tax=Marinobacter sp. TaxID=50741 RepID=UPI0035693DC4